MALLIRTTASLNTGDVSSRLPDIRGVTILRLTSFAEDPVSAATHTPGAKTPSFFCSSMRGPPKETASRRLSRNSFYLLVLAQMWRHGSLLKLEKNKLVLSMAAQRRSSLDNSIGMSLYSVIDFNPFCIASIYSTFWRRYFKLNICSLSSPCCSFLKCTGIRSIFVGFSENGVGCSHSLI